METEKKKIGKRKRKKMETEKKQIEPSSLPSQDQQAAPGAVDRCTHWGSG